MSAGRVVLVMGVAGSGKSTVGEALGRELAAEFLEGDAFHPKLNVEKMRRGEALTDADRAPWLGRLRAEIDALVSDGRDVVVACSALKRAYRKVLLSGLEAQVVFLDVSAEELKARLGKRRGHFFDPGLLDSQLATLEPPPGAIRVDAGRPLEAVVADVAAAVRAWRGD